jgi:hypothetical protein
MNHRRTLSATALAAALAVATAVTPAAAGAATAYTLEPLNYNLQVTTPTLFDGAVCQVYDCERVPTAASLDLSHSQGVFGENGPISDGARTLNTTLVADDGEKLVFGFSQGAQIAGFWLRNYAPDTTVDRATTSFLLVGDPENTYGVPWAPNVPVNTGFDVTEVWAQYDGWADWPARFDLLAIANAVYGMFFVHPTVYDDMDLEAEEAAGNVVTWQANGITYKMVRNQNLPMLDPLRRIGLGFIADIVNDDWRAHIERQYDRPATQEEADAEFGTPEEEQTQPLEDSDHAGDESAADSVEVSAEFGDEQPMSRMSARKQSRLGTAEGDLEVDDRELDEDLLADDPEPEPEPESDEASDADDETADAPTSETDSEPKTDETADDE